MASFCIRYCECACARKAFGAVMSPVRFSTQKDVTYDPGKLPALRADVGTTGVGTDVRCLSCLSFFRLFAVIAPPRTPLHTGPQPSDLSMSHPATKGRTQGLQSPRTAFICGLARKRWQVEHKIRIVALQVLSLTDFLVCRDLTNETAADSFIHRLGSP